MRTSTRLPRAPTASSPSRSIRPSCIPRSSTCWRNVTAVADPKPVAVFGAWRERVRSASLSARLIAASAVLALLVVAAFGVLVYAVSTLDDATKRERHARAVTAATLQLEKLVLDLETGLRGFVVTGRTDALQPWRAARAELPAKLAAFRRAASTPVQKHRAAALANLIDDYVNDYAIPVVKL